MCARHARTGREYAIKILDNNPMIRKEKTMLVAPQKNALTIEQHVQECMKALEDFGDGAMKSEKAAEVITNYTAALSLNSSNPTGLLVKRSRARAMQSLWEDALKYADKVRFRFSLSSMRRCKITWNQEIKPDPHIWGKEGIRHCMPYSATP
jgi:hypothetical protein